jgi:hypothetical protein
LAIKFLQQKKRGLFLLTHVAWFELSNQKFIAVGKDEGGKQSYEPLEGCLDKDCKFKFLGWGKEYM